MMPPRGLVQYHWPLPDPAAVQGSEDDVRAAFRKSRDEIRRRLQDLVNSRILVPE
jgi:arsenate reductase